MRHCLAEIISKAAYTGQADVFAAGFACEVLGHILIERGIWLSAGTNKKIDGEDAMKKTALV